MKPVVRGTPAQRIVKTPGVCGGAACVRGTRIPVWLLVEARQLGCDDAELLASYPDLSAADLRAAWAYAVRHADEIATDLRENEEA